MAIRWGARAARVADFKPGRTAAIKLDPTKPEDSLFLGSA